MARQLRIAVFGGSNSVMAPGYLNMATEILSDVHGFEVKVSNPSAGANTSAFGLLSMKLGGEIESNDVFVIEYGINDFELSRPDNWIYYCGIVEGMVRETLRRNPRAQVFLIQFGRRPKQTAVFYEKMLQFSLTLSERYRVHTVPVDSYLKRILPEEEFVQAYSDDLHYRRHMATSFIGCYVANFIAAAVQADKAPEGDAAPLSALTFEDAVGLNALDLLSAPQRVFENSRYVEPTVTIAAGATVSFDVPGSLLLMRFVSCPTSCRVMITESDGEALTFDTLNKEVANGKFPFLIRSTPFSRRRWAGVAKGKPNRITVSVLAKDDDRPLTVVRGDMVGPTASQDLAFHLSAVLVW